MYNKEYLIYTKDGKTLLREKNASSLIYILNIKLYNEI